jgi:transposase
LEEKMPQKGLSMRNVREILRLHFEGGLSRRQIARSCNVSHSTVVSYLKRATQAGLAWPLPLEMDDTALERLITSPPTPPPARRPLPDAAYLLQEMRKKHVTLALLWQEYRDTHPDGYGYTQFCHCYHEARRHLDVTLRQEHHAGEKLFTDFAGDTLPVVDPHTGQTHPAYLFVAVLGASSYTFARAVLCMNLANWVELHVQALEFLGGVPEILVPDNTSCAVLRPDRYEPDLNPSFAQMAAHYGTAIIPARVRKPRDKAKVEAGVLLAERWILAALRHQRFFALAELNDAIAPLLVRLNTHPFQRLPTCRAELFERLDRPALKPLPERRYSFQEWKKAKVAPDYHVLVAEHFYSVPYQLVGQEVEACLSASTVEILYRHRRVASHVRSFVKGGFTTDPAHRPKSHQAHLEWTPTRMIAWAGSVGPHTAALVAHILASRPHPEMGYRSCLGIIRLGKEYPPERLEAAAARALRANVTTYRSLKSILDHGRDRVGGDAPETPPPVAHANLRGREYYQN